LRAGTTAGTTAGASGSGTNIQHYRFGGIDPAAVAGRMDDGSPQTQLGFNLFKKKGQIFLTLFFGGQDR